MRGASHARSGQKIRIGLLQFFVVADAELLDHADIHVTQPRKQGRFTATDRGNPLDLQLIFNLRLAQGEFGNGRIGGKRRLHGADLAGRRDHPDQLRLCHAATT